MEKEKLTRGENRIIAGVISAFAKKYNFEPWILWIGLIVISIYSYYAIVIYLVVWLIIPNEIIVQNSKQIRNQILGIVIGAILGALLCGGFTFFFALITNDPGNGGIAPILVALMSIPLGAVIGFSIVRAIAEKRSFKTRK